MPHKGQYELEIYRCPPSRKTKNENGLMIWAKVKHSTNSLYGPGHTLKVHMCFQNPCRVHWKDDKYGPYGPPVHMQCITCMGPRAAPLSQFTAAPVADPSSIATAVDVVAPSTATAVAAQTHAADAGAAKRAAIDRIRASALQLAREIRKPRAWIGYVAFVLFALLKNRPQMWEGASRFCVIDTFAPWAKDLCKNECAYAAIPCALQKNTKVSLSACKRVRKTRSPACRTTWPRSRFPTPP